MLSNKLLFSHFITVTGTGTSCISRFQPFCISYNYCIVYPHFVLALKGQCHENCFQTETVG